MTHVRVKVLTRNSDGFFHFFFFYTTKGIVSLRCTVSHESIRTAVVKFDDSLLSLEETFRNFHSSTTTLNYRDRIGTIFNFTEFNKYKNYIYRSAKYRLYMYNFVDVYDTIEKIDVLSVYTES